MLKSDLIKELTKDIEDFGDEYVLLFRLETLDEITERKMISTRKGKHGNSLKMNYKEFKEWIDKQKAGN